MSDVNFEFQCPQFIDFNDPQTWVNNDQENDAYFGLKKAEDKLPESKKVLIEQVGPKPLQPIVRSKTRTILGVKEELVKAIEAPKKPNLFKATPLNRKMFERQFVGGIPRITPAKSCIKTKEPHFKTDERLQQRKAKVITNDHSTAPCANHSVAATPSRPRPPANKPFSFVERDIQRWNERMEKIRKNLIERPEEQLPVYHFKAQPVPSASKTGPRFAPKPIKPPTQFCAFSFQTDERLKVRKVKDAEHEEKMKAHCAVSVFKKPLLPKASLLKKAEVQKH